MQSILRNQVVSLASKNTGSWRPGFLSPWTLRMTRANHKIKISRTSAIRLKSTATGRPTSARESVKRRDGFRNFMLKPRTLPVPRWISPQYYTITLSEICGHASFMLVAISYAVDDFLQLRIIAVAGSAVMLCFTYFHPHGKVLWLPFKWNALFIAINSYRIGKVYLDRFFAEKLSPEMLRIRDQHFYAVDPPDFARLVRIGKIETHRPGDLLVAQGELNRYIRLVIDGEYRCIRDGQVTYLVEEGNFISETGLHAGLLLPGRVEACCGIVANTSGRTIRWERNELMELLNREKALRRALKVALSWDIVRKLKGQRFLLSSGVIDDPDGWTQRRTEQSRHRYAAILQNMLAHRKYLSERKGELEKYRLIHHIDDDEHELALKRNGWTVEDFERGFKEGHEFDEEEDEIKHDMRWFAHDLYMRVFG